ncbi:guanylin family protein [Chiloscyllium plagiosum]|uniref:guanylin family protein n=1 Tax=Chiloscyllium plagiosum TaxID=36176 RepID=UPI001CB8412E|nr:guanylin family protein [Chiloscyllium plagiosum]
MRTLLVIFFLTCGLSSLMANVIVQDGDYKFPLDDVKQLWALMDTDKLGLPDDDKAYVSTLCNDSKLPNAFQPVCSSSDALQVFNRLEKLTMKADLCEICAYAACTGC